MHKNPLLLALDELQLLYDKLPPVKCIGCGTCCVSPTCTLIEFLYLMHHISEFLGKDEQYALFTGTITEDHRYEGNIVCKLQQDKSCVIHPVRTAACRLFGMPSVDSMKIPGLVRCKHPPERAPTNNSNKFVKEWLRKLVQINRTLYPMGEPPFYLTGLSIECWMDVAFVDKWNHPFFGHLQLLIRSSLQFDFAEVPKPRTGIADKVNAIDEFNRIMDCGDSERLRNLLLKIRDDFPLTGTWYYEEANFFLEHIAKFHELEAVDS